MRDLYLPYPDMEQMFKRMAFSVIAGNQDDHTKNIAFLLPENDHWRLSLSYDVNWSFNPDGGWTSLHQMNVTGKRSHFKKSDLVEFGKRNDIDDPAHIIEGIMNHCCPVKYDLQNPPPISICVDLLLSATCCT